MQRWLADARSSLAAVALRALRANVANNRSGLPPFRLPQVAQQMLTGLAEYLGQPAPEPAQALGERLASQGLGLRSLLAVNRALTREVHAMAPEADEPGLAARLEDFADLLVDGLARFEVHDVVRQHNELQAAYERAVATREHALRQVIEELSTPVMPVHDKILVLPLIGTVDRARAQRITESLLEEVAARRAQILIIDITGVATIDEEVAAALLRAARAVELLGARPVIVGIRPALARVLIQSGTELGGLMTLATLQTGIEWALRQQGLAVQRR